MYSVRPRLYRPTSIIGPKYLDYQPIYGHLRLYTEDLLKVLDAHISYSCLQSRYIKPTLFDISIRGRMVQCRLEWLEDAVLDSVRLYSLEDQSMTCTNLMFDSYLPLPRSGKRRRYSEDGQKAL